MKKIITILLTSTLFSACGCSTSETKDSIIEPASPEAVALALVPSEDKYINLDYIEFDPRDKIRTQKWAQIIKSNLCKDDPLCEFIKNTSSVKEKIVLFNYKNLDKIQSLSVATAYKGLKQIKDKDIIKKSNSFISSNSAACPRNLTAAALLKVESQLPDPEAWETMVSLYNSLLECPINSNYESAYLRMTLHFLNRNQLPQAQIAIKNALALPNKDELSRILYWGGVLLDDKALLQELIKVRPYTLHAILASDLLQVNLWSKFKSKPKLVEQRENTLFSEVYEKLLYYKQVDAAFELINDNIKEDFLAKNPNYLFYLIRLMDLHGRTDYTIRLVSRIGQLYPDSFNIQYIQIAYKNTYLPLFETYAPETDPYLMLSLSKQESGFYARATSRVRAKGLMQLMPSTARLLSKKKSKDLYDVDNNVYLGSLYFKNLYDRYNKVELALAAYNAGPSRVDQWKQRYSQENPLAFLDLIPFKETRQYVSTILRNNYFYRQLFEETKSWSIESKVIHYQKPLDP